MRIVAWNCCRGPFEKKLAALATLTPDIAVLPEAIHPAKESNQVLWFPTETSRLGIQVRAYNGYKLRRLKTFDLPNCVVPIRVTGPTCFNLLAVWTWPAPSYVKALANGLSAYSALFDKGDTVVAGDFNGNPVFDKPRRRFKWSDSFSVLADAALVSAYHHAHRINFGRERHPTHHFLRNPERPFHIDFCFVPQRWAKRGLKVKIERSALWRSLSDHFPIVVTSDI
jgi:exodeoxyribonuclease-3